MKLPPPFSEDGLLNVLVETSKGSINKYVWDDSIEFFKLKKVLPEGLQFPADFGFIPGTMAEDDAPLDVVLLNDERVCTGAMVACRVLGITEVEQTEDNKTVRNDRVIAVADASHQYADIKDVHDLQTDWLEQVNSFFSYYHELEGTKQKVLSVSDEEKAMELIKKSIV